MDQSTRACVEKLVTKLEVVVAQLEAEYRDQPCMLEKLGVSKTIAQAYIWAYGEGRPFFDREMLADLDRQIDAFDRGTGDEEGLVRIVDVAGRVKHWHLLPPDTGTSDSYIVMYRAYQYMTHMSSAHPYGLLNPVSPVFIGHTNSRKASGWSLWELQEAFRTHQKAWLQSPVCKSLVGILRSVKISTPISKIVCFGLGCLDAWEKTTRAELQETVERSATQHAAALTMAEVLVGQRGQRQAPLCYAQDPIYTDVQKRLLASVGILVLNDPKGFLEVDSNTLVFSVTPNVPVRQIIADVQWPAAMVWNKVQPETEYEYDKDYTFEEENGRKTRVS